MSRKKSKANNTNQKTKEEKQPEEIVVEPGKKQSPFGRLLRIPVDVLYLIIGLIAGIILGIVSFVVFPVLIPFYMVKSRFA